MKKRLDNFFTKDYHLFVFIGAFIVFMTFLVKGVVRDRWKETADVVDMAQYFYGLHNESTQERKQAVNDRNAAFFRELCSWISFAPTLHLSVQ
jgi:hypothetical protein